MNKLLKDSKRFLDKNASTILTFIGGAGVIATTIVAIKDTPKAVKLLEEAKNEKGEELTKLEVVKVAGPVYIPTILTGATTIACIFGANTLNKRQQASLMSAYALLDSSYKEYKNKIIDLHGEEADINARAEIAKDEYEKAEIDGDEEDGQLFYDNYSHRYFRSTPEDVLRAELKVNEILNHDAYLSLNELYDELGLEQVPYGDDVGWSSAQMFEMYWNSWIHFRHEEFETDDGLEGTIITFTDPSINFKDY